MHHAVQSFLSQARPDIRNGTFTTTSVDSFKPPNQGTSEAVRAAALLNVRLQ